MFTFRGAIVKLSFWVRVRVCVRFRVRAGLGLVGYYCYGQGQNGNVCTSAPETTRVPSLYDYVNFITVN